MTRRAPGHKVAHLVPPRKSDSIRGVKWAKAHGYKWIDVNCLLSRDGIAYAQHGSPYGLASQGFLPSGDKRKVKDLHSSDLNALRSHDGYQVPTIGKIFRAAARLGVNVELEAKDDRRFKQVATWEEIAELAHDAWGPDWAEHVVVKVLTNLSGGPIYARTVCRSAHSAGFQTMVLPRGLSRIKKVAGPAITYNRGGRV